MFRVDLEKTRKQIEEDDILDIVYNDGRGRLRLDLHAVIPASASNMRKIRSFIDNSEHRTEYAQLLAVYIMRKISDAENMKAEAQAAKLRVNLQNLIKNYGVEIPEAAKPEDIKMKKADVYSLHRDDYTENAERIEIHTGWTFEKGGHVFDMYRSDDKVFEIMLHDTGLKIGPGNSKKADALKTVDNFMEYVNSPKNADYLRERKEEFKLHLEADMEVNYMKKTVFKNHAMIIDGKEYAAEYNISDTGAVLAFQIVGQRDNGRLIKHKTVIGPEHAYFDEALAAARGNAGNAPEEAAPEPANADPEPVKHAAPEARGPVKEKTFIGTEITGHGWKILFDGETARTRVIFEGTPEPAAKKAVEDARFFWSPNMQSFNKKLTFKAYRAAVKLADVLNEIYAA